MLSPLVSMALNLMLSEEDSKRCRAENHSVMASFILCVGRETVISRMCYPFGLNQPRDQACNPASVTVVDTDA